MGELDKETEKPCTVQSVDVKILLLTGAMQSRNKTSKIRATVKAMFKTLSKLEGTEVRCLSLMGMGHSSKYMVLEKFASHSTIVIKLTTRLISSAHCMFRAPNCI